MTIMRLRCSGNEQNMLKKQSTVNIQNTEDDHEIFVSILSIFNFKTILSLLHSCDLSLCAWVQIDTKWIPTAEESRVSPRTNLLL